MPEPCSDCSYSIPDAASCCPHCGRPSRFPNVRAAEAPEQRRALDERYALAVKAANADGSAAALATFESAAAGSSAVIARGIKEADRVATSDKEGYATYYQLQEAEVRFPSGEAWDMLRRTADQALFTGYADKLRFAALSVDGLGLSSYGDCSMRLRDSMIAHRTSVFEGNSTTFCQDKIVQEIPARALGRRSTWDTRGKLCVAKLAGRIDPSTGPGDHAQLLLKQGATSADDHFVEAQVYGPMTIRTFDRMTVTRSKGRFSKTIFKAFRERLKQFGVDLDDRR